MSSNEKQQPRPFDRLTATAVAIDQPNVDTDQIIPARFLALPRSEQAAHLFNDVRYREDGTPREGFPLNAPTAKGAQILIAERNFGCGSSREHAVTVLVDNGFRAFIAPSFGDIFHNNSFQNSALPIRLPAERIREMLDHLARRPDASITIDLEAQTVTGPDNWTQSFEIDSFRKQCLLQGTDDISLTLGYEADIAAFERQAAAQSDWL
jgi:3-isopropylmalate/(R)-2-methylmalate dehydratase small subunit